MKRLPSAVLLAVTGILVGAVIAGDGLVYPPTRRADQVDAYHGTEVADPYRWLEEDVRKSKEVADWVAAENKVTETYFRDISERETIRQRLTELWNFEKSSPPVKQCGRYFFLKNTGLQNQSVLYMQESLESEPRVLIDPNTWSKEGTVALGAWAVSDDGKYIAYAQSEAGSDWQTWHVLSIETGKPLSDELKWTKFRSASWTKDSKGFFYDRFREPKAGAQFHGLNLNQELYYHRVGTRQPDDVLVYRRPDHPDWVFTPLVTEDGRYLIITVAKGTDAKYRITYKDLSEPYSLPIDLIETFDNDYTFVGNDGPIFFFRTNLEATRGRLIAIDIRKPDRSSWKELIPEAKDNLVAVNLVGNSFVAVYLHNAQTQVKLHTMGGKFLRELEFPGIGSASGFGGKRTDTETFYLFSSLATPPSVYRYDILTDQRSLIHQAKVKFNPDDYEVKQVFCTSKDGTQVPMFITHKKGIELDGSNPTLLYGYGGFNIPLTPSFAVGRVAWLEMGGIYAQANLRGGGEYGEAWHRAGTKLKKQNVFDDFIAAAQWLIDHHYTKPAKLAIQGRSNGGLLIGAVMTQRPDLFGACLPGVGVMDMLRFHKFTAGRFWVDDYGSADNAEEFKALLAYSPYHNLKKGTAYPATLVTTADTDDRVVPGHSFKFTAMLQYCQAGPAPVLARIETRAGHGGGKPTSKMIEETADEWTFLVKSLGMKVPVKLKIDAPANSKIDMTEALWEAVRNGDAKAIGTLLDQGADINAKNKIGVSALWIAASKGKREVVELLVRRGADVNSRDGIWYQTPLSGAVGAGDAEMVKFLIRSGAKDINELVVLAAVAGKSAIVQALADSGKVAQDVLDAALASAADNKEVQQVLQKAGAKAVKPASKEDRAAWAPLVGAYENENGGKLTIEMSDAGLVARRFGYPHPLKSFGADTFRPVGMEATYTFVREGPQATRLVVKYFTSELTYYRLETKPVINPVQPPKLEQTSVDAPLNWPSFRGPDASGLADGQHPPVTWDIQKGVNVRWKTPIPGLGHSCPIVWSDRVFVTTAQSGDADPKVRIGNYGDVESVNDTTPHRWQIFCLDRDSGKILWSRTALEGVPKIKRHLKGSQANCTPATDGKHVVACFGSEGLYCYDFSGKLLWQRDLGTLDSSFAIDVKYEWGFGSSPIIYQGLVILQCDLGKDSFIAAYRLEDGSQAWSTPRDEIPSWSTPTIWRNARRVELVTNAAQYARGYDPSTGKELWRIDKKSEVTIPTPIIGRDLAYLTSGNRPIQPIFAIRPGSTGDISLKPNEQRSDQIAWSRMRGGPYMATPIIYGDYLYICGNGGMVTCYHAETGKEIYKERLGGESYTASPVAADQRLYFTSEQGDIRVVKAGPKFQLLAVNQIGDVCMATPAISCGMLFVRSQHFLFALGQKPSAN